MTEPSPIYDPFAGGGGPLFSDLKKPCWISYPRAEKGLRRLQDLLDAPESHRPTGMLLYGDSNSGKTTLVRHFQTLLGKKLSEQSGDDDVRDRNPVLIVQSPPYPSTGALLENALRALGSPHKESWHWERKLTTLVDVLRRLNIQMVAIDEIHAALTNPHDKRVLFLNTIKYLSNELKIPFVVIGTSLALNAIQSDQQLGSRLVPFKLQKWNADKDFGMFLGKVLTHLKLDAVSAINSRGFREQFIHMTDGLTGEVWHLSVKIADVLQSAGTNKVDETVFQQVDWTRPQDRRVEPKRGDMH